MSPPLILIQARTASTRLPGKINMQIGHKSMLSHVYDRCRTVGETLICKPEMFPECPEEDVLERLVRAYLYHNEYTGRYWEPIVRITADCPMLDTGLMTGMIDRWYRSEASIVYTGPEWDGLDVEVIHPAALLTAHAFAKTPYEREHVTPSLKELPDAQRIDLRGPSLRWSVDDIQGLDFVRRVFRACFYCEQGVPHHTNAESSIGGWDRAPVWDLHHLTRGDLIECTAHEVLKERMGGRVYQSV